MGFETTVVAVSPTANQGLAGRMTSANNRRQQNVDSASRFPRHSTSNSPDFTVEQERTCFGINLKTAESWSSWALGFYASMSTVDHVLADFNNCFRIPTAHSCVPYAVSNNEKGIKNSAKYLIPYSATFLAIRTLQRCKLIDPSRSPRKYAILAGIVGVSLLP